MASNSNTMPTCYTMLGAQREERTLDMPRLPPCRATSHRVQETRKKAPLEAVIVSSKRGEGRQCRSTGS